MSEPKQCARKNCSRPSRARGYCENHYREALRREHGVGGIEPKDSCVYKIRVRLASGYVQPLYYSNEKIAKAKADLEASRGRLLYFARYDFAEEMI